MTYRQTPFFQSVERIPFIFYKVTNSAKSIIWVSLRRNLHVSRIQNNENIVSSSLGTKHFCFDPESKETRKTSFQAVNTLKAARQKEGGVLLKECEYSGENYRRGKDFIFYNRNLPSSRCVYHYKRPMARKQKRTNLK